MLSLVDDAATWKVMGREVSLPLSGEMDKDGIAIRAGHHCAMPLHHELGINSSARASFYLHTTTEEVDKLVQSLNRAKKIFRL